MTALEHTAHFNAERTHRVAFRPDNTLVAQQKTQVVVSLNAAFGLALDAS